MTRSSLKEFFFVLLGVCLFLVLVIVLRYALLRSFVGRKVGDDRVTVQVVESRELTLFHSGRSLSVAYDDAQVAAITVDVLSDLASHMLAYMAEGDVKLIREFSSPDAALAELHDQLKALEMPFCEFLLVSSVLWLSHSDELSDHEVLAARAFSTMSLGVLHAYGLYADSPDVEMLVDRYQQLDIAGEHIPRLAELPGLEIAAEQVLIRLGRTVGQSR